MQEPTQHIQKYEYTSKGITSILKGFIKKKPSEFKQKKNPKHILQDCTDLGQGGGLMLKCCSALYTQTVIKIYHLIIYMLCKTAVSF